MLRRALTIEPESALVMAGLAESYWHRYGLNRETSSRDEAQLWLDEAAQREPGLAEVRYARALCASVEGRLDEAAALLRAVVTQKPGFAAAWLKLGDVLGAQGNSADGLAAFERALRLEPGNFRLHLYRGLFYDQFQEHEEAARNYKEATVLKPESRSAWNNQAAALLRTGQYEQAIPALHRSLEIDEYADARSNLGTTYYLLGRYAENILQPF